MSCCYMLKEEVNIVCKKENEMRHKNFMLIKKNIYLFLIILC